MEEKGLSSLVETQQWRMSRRAFGRLALGVVAILAQGLGSACEPPPKKSNDPFNKPEPALPQCAAISSEEAKTIEAFCEVCIPGVKSDPLKKPGAVESCAVALFFDPELPAAALVPLIVALIDDKARALHKDRFVALSMEQQIETIDRLDREVEIFGFAIQLVRLAFYSSELAAYQLRYPGANEGYHQHPDFSFRKPMSAELTSDGNMP